MWNSEIAHYLTYLAAAGRAPGTIRQRRLFLERLARRFAEHSPWALGIDELARFIGEPRWKPETRKGARATLVGFYRWAEQTGRISASPAELLPPVRVPRSLPRPTPDAVLASALARAETEDDRLMLLIAMYGGLRCSEIARIHSDDIIGKRLRVTGKGGRVRMVPIHPVLGAALAGRQGWIFPGRWGGHITPSPVIKHLSALLGPGWTGHTLRHRFATRAYAVDKDIIAVQQLLGHAKLETTIIYTEIPDESLVAAVGGVGLAA